tara:strand:+ start:398 stop:1129 length:732 start_codon:yes stop_codon:yes gene_type:complete
MGFQLRSKGSSPCLQQNQNLTNKIAAEKEDLSKYAAQSSDSLNFTKSFQVPNILGNNRKQAKATASQMFGQMSQGYNTKGNATANQGGLFSDTKTTGGTTLEAVSFSDGTPNTVTEKDIYKQLRSTGGAKVENNVLTPVTTHENTKTINRNQYDRKKNNITKLESLLNKNTNSEATKTAKKEEVKLAISNRYAANSKKRGEAAASLANRRAMFKTKVAEKRALVVERKAKAEAKKKAKLQNQR